MSQSPLDISMNSATPEVIPPPSSDAMEVDSNPKPELEVESEVLEQTQPISEQPKEPVEKKGTEVKQEDEISKQTEPIDVDMEGNQSVIEIKPEAKEALEVKTENNGVIEEVPVKEEAIPEVKSEVRSTPRSTPRPVTKSATPQVESVDPVEDEDEDDTIQKLHDLEVLPDLFNLLHDLESGVISARDFDKNSGSIRLKLATLKQYLQEVEGIDETIEGRQAKIQALRVSNSKKREFLTRVRATVESELV